MKHIAFFFAAFFSLIASAHAERPDMYVVKICGEFVVVPPADGDITYSNYGAPGKFTSFRLKGVVKDVYSSYHSDHSLDIIGDDSSPDMSNARIVNMMYMPHEYGLFVTNPFAGEELKTFQAGQRYCVEITTVKINEPNLWVDLSSIGGNLKPESCNSLLK